MIEMIITSSVLILVIFLLRKITRGRISMRFRYALWLVVVLRLLLPVSVGNSAVSIWNLLPLSWQETIDVWEDKGGLYLSGNQKAATMAADGSLRGDMASAFQNGFWAAQTGEEHDGTAGKEAGTVAASEPKNK